MENADWAKEFRFNHCLWSQNPTDATDLFAGQEEVFKVLGSSICDRAMSGISSSCFAYGHTGTGKTHTMFGDIVPTDVSKSFSSGNSVQPLLASSISTVQSQSGVSFTSGFRDFLKNESSYGLVPRVFIDIVNRILNDSSSCADVKITLSFLDIYNEKIRDLLSNSESKELRIREHPVIGPSRTNTILRSY